MPSTESRDSGSLQLRRLWKNFPKLPPEQQIYQLGTPGFLNGLVNDGKGEEVLNFMIDEFSSPQVANVMIRGNSALAFTGKDLAEVFVRSVRLLNDDDQKRVLGIPGLREAISKNGVSLKDAPAPTGAK